MVGLFSSFVSCKKRKKKGLQLGGDGVEVEFVEFFACCECAEKLNELERHKQEILKTRAKLSRCQGCARLLDLKKEEAIEDLGIEEELGY